MAGQTKYVYPADEQILQRYSELGKLQEVAKSFGIPHRTFESHLERQGLRPKLQKLRAKKPVPVETEEVSEVEILRERVRELESDRRQRRRTDVRDERIILAFEDALADKRPKYQVSAAKTRASLRTKHEHVLLLSDLHAGEVVSEEEVLGLNSYSWQIMLQRLARIQQAVLSFQEHRPYAVERLHVCMLGDMLSGDIHPDLTDTNEWPLAACTVQLGLDLSTWLEEFTPHYAEISVAGVVGNHPRLTPKPRSKQTAQTNADWILYRMIETYHRNNPAFSFNFPQAKYAEIMLGKRWRTLLMHGDGIRSSMIDVPFGGIIRYAQKLEGQFNRAGRPLDYICAGHWHTMNAIDGIGSKTYINGSLKGPDEWSLQRFGGARPPGQLLLTVHPKRGVTDVSYLDCIDSYPNSEAVAQAAAA